jgi:hypothetical protein
MVSILKFLNDFDHSYVNVDQSVSLSVYRSKNKNNFPKVLFFPGFISTLLQLEILYTPSHKKHRTHLCGVKREEIIQNQEQPEVY